MVKTVMSCLTAIALSLAVCFPAFSAGRDAFIELSADKAEVYVQEQLILTIQLYFSGTLVQGDLSEPGHPDAIIERLGSQQESVQYRDGTRYRVIERRYAIFPQEPGSFTLPAIRFEGHVRDSSSRQLRSVRDSQQLYEVPVKSIPDEYPADTPWLPASNLSLSEEGLPRSRELEAGSNLTRKLTLQATGLPAEALPPFPQRLSGGIRQYPDQPLRNTDATQNGLQSVLQQSFALVPVQAGETVVPRLSIPWWNTKTDELEEAVLPATTYQITGAEAVVATPDINEADNATDTARGSDSGGGETQSVSGWIWSTLVFVLLWLATLALWWRSRGKKTNRPQAPRQQSHSEKQAFDDLIQSVTNSSAQASGLLLRWARVRYPGQAFASTQDLTRYLNDKELETAMEDYQEALFSARGGKSEVNKEVRTRLIKAIGRAARHKEGASQESLPSLYPAELSG